nr:hypothetical protein [Tanacetum cinerariifolium]
MFSASPAVTYTSVYTDSEPGKVFWGADKELSDRGSPRVIVYEYDRLPMRTVAPPSPDYIPGPEEPQKSPVPQDEDEHEPMFIQPHDPDYVPEPMYLEIYDEDDDDGDSSVEDTDDEDEQEEEEEHLALVDSAIVIPTVELVSPPEGTEPIIPPPSTDTTATGARITALIDAVTAALPSPPLPPLLCIPPPVDRRDDIPKTEMPPRKRDTWVDPAEAVLEIAPMTVGEVYTRVTELAELHEHDTQDLYARLEDAQDNRTHISQRVTMDSQRAYFLMKDRTAHQETILIVEEEAYAAREAWAHSIGLNMRREMGDMQAELLALREQPRRARRPGEDARVPDHQDAPRDTDSHI